MDSEYLDLCREVYKRTKWWQKEARAIFNPKDNGAGLYKYFEGYQYTTDYLLEMLPKELHKDEKIHYLTLSSKYGDEFKANYVSPTGHLYLFMEPEDDTSLKALLRLTIALHEAGELTEPVRPKGDKR